MEREIVRLWNEKVTSNDDVYILGDVFYRFNGRPADFLGQLSGSKNYHVFANEILKK